MDRVDDAANKAANEAADEGADERTQSRAASDVPVSRDAPAAGRRGSPAREVRHALRCTWRARCAAWAAPPAPRPSTPHRGAACCTTDYGSGCRSRGRPGTVIRTLPPAGGAADTVSIVNAPETVMNTALTPWFRLPQPDTLCGRRSAPASAPPRSLAKGATPAVRRPAGVTVECRQGCLWLTHDGDARDIVLNAGERYVSTLGQRLLVHALEDAQAVVAR